jgi:transmembrane sensor
MGIQEELFNRFISNECTQEEIKALLEHFSVAENEALLRELILKALQADRPLTGDIPDLDEKEEQIYASILPHLKTERRVSLWPRIAAAASVLLFLTAGGWFLLHKKIPVQGTAQYQFHDILPGSNKATLILADGRKIALSDAPKGVIASQGQMLINKSQDGKIIYQNDKEHAGEISNAAFNILLTQRGEQSSVILSDGTVAYLDAASSIRYPVVFMGRERRVEITGQVYFEVTHNAARPFRVNVKGETIEDLGTHFNINAYDDEPVVMTTLEEGSIKVSILNAFSSRERTSIKLKPGQQASVSANNAINLITDGDIASAVAWKKGYFKFEDEDLKSIMRKISRWYNVDIAYSNNLPGDISLFGKVSRSKNISEVIKIMEATKRVHIRVEGRRVIVMP